MPASPPAALVLSLADEAATVALGRRLGAACAGGALIYLQGELGAGKTTLARGMLRGLGHEGAVKSPTFTLVEPYRVGERSVHHFDLYRLTDPEELEYIGVRDYFEAGALCLVEWPERGLGHLPRPDLALTMEHAGPARRAVLEACSETGAAILARI